MKLETEHVFVCPLCEELNDLELRKVSPENCRTILSVERMGEVANNLESPEGLSEVHDVFHVSQLKKCHAEMANIPL